jgi:general secretion pathway protein I
MAAVTLRTCRRMKLNQRGFTLIEVVVAFAILALTTGVLYESFGWSLRSTAALQKQEAAWLAAQSLLAELRASDVLTPGHTSGQTVQGLNWTTEITLRKAESKDDANTRLKPFNVTIDVNWGQRPAQRITLQSVATARLAT